MVSLTDYQLRSYGRGTWLARREARYFTAAHRRHAGCYGRFTNTDVADVAQLALAGLVQKTTDAA
jgi:hypothetical protein